MGADAILLKLQMSVPRKRHEDVGTNEEEYGIKSLHRNWGIIKILGKITKNRSREGWFCRRSTLQVLIHQSLCKLPSAFSRMHFYGVKSIETSYAAEG